MSAALRGAALALLVLAAVPATAMAQAAPAAATPPGDAAPSGEEAALQAFERIGRDLFRADRVAWLTTDQLHAQGLVDGGRLVGVEGDPDGWITAPTEDPAVWRVAYIVELDDVASAFADGTVDFTAEPLASLRRNDPVRPLDAAELAQRARVKDAIGRDWMSCSRRPYNIATVPDAQGGWHVYLLPPQTSATAFPMGGFHRFSYDAQGNLVSAYAHTRGCIEQSRDGLPAGATLDSLMITHITSATPNEFHVFMSLSYGLPVYVATTDRRLWRVADGDIALVSQLDGPGE